MFLRDSAGSGYQCPVIALLDDRDWLNRRAIRERE
jgi:hypothetical protein